MRAIELLNRHLDDIVVLNNKQYSREKVLRVYNKLNPPIPEGNFYQGQRVSGNISKEGVVSFRTYYPETGWNFESPSELNTFTESPPPRQELIQMSRAFNELLDSPQGKVVYTNTPLSPHRARAYEKMGFSPASDLDEMLASRGDMHTQVLDNRRFANLPAIKELYAVSRSGRNGFTSVGGSYTYDNDNSFYSESEQPQYYQLRRDGTLSYADDFTPTRSYIEYDDDLELFPPRSFE